MTAPDRATREQRARLRAEQLLAQKSRELNRLNADLQAHARTLSRQVIDQRSLIDVARTRAHCMETEKARIAERLTQALRTLDIMEARLAAGIDALSDGVAIYGPDNRLVLANAAYLRPFRAWPEAAPGIHRARVLELCAEGGLVTLGDEPGAAWIARMLARWDDDPIPDAVIVFADGRHIRLMDRRAPHGDVVSLARDITDIVQHEAALRDAMHRAEAANRAKSAFLANMSHEIRTPMNGVVAMADLLCDTALSDDQRLYAETIRSSAEALLRLINDVLDSSRIEAEKLTLHPAPFDLELCIHEVLMLAQPEAAARGLDLWLDYDLFLPSGFLGDAGRVRQVLTNLVGNAVKFTDAGHVRVRVTGMPGAEGMHKLHLTVEDTGIGIAPEDRDRIFGAFQQVEDDRNRRFEGSGLGLSITRQLVTLMGGELWMDSTPGEGSCFGLRLALPEAELPDAHAGGTEPVLGLRHALIIDPNDFTRATLERQLAPHSAMRTLCASLTEVEDALRGAAGPPPDLVVLAGANGGSPGVADTDPPGALRRAGVKAPAVLLCPASAVPAEGGAAFAAIVHQPVLRRRLIAAIRGVLDAAPAPAPARAPPLPAPATASAPDAPLALSDLALPDLALPDLAMSDPGPARRLRVLSAEDNRTNRLVLERMLADQPVDLAFAVDGHEAVTQFSAFRPDLIFMDISMPGMDGRAATRAIRALPEGAGVPIIALTAHALPGDEDGFRAAGMTGYLTKPLRKAALLEVLRAHGAAV